MPHWHYLRKKEMSYILNNLQIEKAFIESYEVALFSKDPSTQNGAILYSKAAKVVGRGWNHFPPGVPEEYWNGPKEAKYARVVHAEVAAIIDAAKHNGGAQGGVLICGWAACSNCAKHIADSGIKELIRHSYKDAGGDPNAHWYEDVLMGDEIMKEAGVAIFDVPPVGYAIELRRNGQIWTPNASKQNELSSPF